MPPIQRDETGHIVPREMKPYNERLFGKGFRGFLHTARFRWLRRSLQQLHITEATVIELGCFDGKTLDYLPFQPTVYKGYDADWEGGLSLAGDRWKEYPQYAFFKSLHPGTFNPGGEQFDIAIVMETFEHLPLAELPVYIAKVKEATRHYLFISVPVEKGPVAVAKNLVKKLFLKVDEHYTWKELGYALTGNMKKVARVELGHKGFDYAAFLELLSAQFEVLQVEGMPLRGMTPWLSFSVGIIARPKAAEK